MANEKKQPDLSLTKSDLRLHIETAVDKGVKDVTITAGKWFITIIFATFVGFSISFYWDLQKEVSQLMGGYSVSTDLCNYKIENYKREIQELNSQIAKLKKENIEKQSEVL